MSNGFKAKKLRIVQQLDTPDDQYSDLSPKGSVDEGIRALVDEINAIPTLVTTSSCAGRISVFLEGRKKGPSEGLEPQAVAGPGGKGGGGNWLYVSHEPLSSNASTLHDLFGLGSQHEDDAEYGPDCRLVHFKFEAMIIHLLATSLKDAQLVLSAALQAGFRESGAVSLASTPEGGCEPMVAIRSTGLALDAIVGYQTAGGDIVSIVSEAHLHTLVTVARERFGVNAQRIARFRTALLASYGGTGSPAMVWEDPEERRRRKREEGLARQRALKEERN
ncbi:hypothetical protein EJ06DRAFT_486924 [Trichodelitschia bisporula]|uniref:tRNA(Phe) 7-[(3-amino-3-carboxypropyl)-4-demethylwyosine(37)-N(4)]-methyltransferase n=1 Tax=Trichodelitschia bisporula TaxID=703511 RepID=A0A6G1I7L2_9PEZI|nr:hypothetical protein EJ06DRAFT_486924 [Trichodelitschia bisporula]